MKEVQRLEQEKGFLSGKLLDVANEVRVLKQRATEYGEKKAEIELHEHELKLLRERVEVE